MKYNKLFKTIEEKINVFNEKLYLEIDSYLSIQGVEKFFLQEIIKSKDILKWTIFLDSKKYFKAPMLKEIEKIKQNRLSERWFLLCKILETSAKNISDHTDKNIKRKVITIIEKVITFYKKDIFQKISIRPFMFSNILFNLPEKNIKSEHLLIIKDILSIDNLLISSNINEFIPKVSHSKKLSSCMLDILLSYKIEERDFIDTKIIELVSMVDKNYIKKILNDYSNKFYELLGVNAFKIASRKLNTIIRNNKNLFNMIGIRTIEDNPQSQFTDKYEYQLIHFIRNVLLLIEKQKIKQVMEYLFWRKHPIYKRLALNTIRYRYNELKEYFWNWVKSSNNILEQIEWKHELWELIHDNSKDFSDDEIRLIVELIEAKNYNYLLKSKITDKEIKAGIAYRKREWLLALEKSENPEVQRKMNEYSLINPAKIDHPGFDFWIGDMEIKEPKITTKDLLEKSNNEIAQLLREFDGPQRYPRHGDSVYDLHNTLEYCVRENPERFVNDLKLFDNCDMAYSSAIISGLKDAWNAKKDFEWGPVFDFIEQFVFNEKFWGYQLPQDSFNYRNWMVESVSALISGGIKNAERSFPREYIDRAESILLIFAKNIDTNLSFSGDVITQVFNSTRGHVYEALLIFSLGYAKMYKSPDSQRWPQTIKDFFIERIIDHPENTPEIWVNIGRFFNNLIYLDRDWVLSNFNYLFPIDDDDRWKSTFIAYLFFTQQIYDNIYKLLKENGHYQKAIYTEFEHVSLHEDIRSVLMSHVAIGYLQGWELLDDNQSLINLVLQRKDSVQIKELINYFWGIQGVRIDNSKQEKLRNLWRELYRILQSDKENPDFQESIARLSLFISKFDKIDDEMLEWINFSSKYMAIHQILYLFVEYLKPLSKTDPENVANIYLNLLTNNIVPEYDEQDIKETIESIYQSGEKDLSDRICNGYFEHGSLILREIYEKYNIE